MNRNDEQAWRDYVAGEVARFHAFSGGVTYLWATTPAAERLVSRLGGDSDLAAFRGPWHVIRKHLSAEFRQWVEEEDATARMTPTEWRAAAVAERAEVAYLDSADYSLGQLAELRRLMGERDALIVEASKRGAAKTAIASAVGLSRQQVHTIVSAAELAPIIPIRADAGDGAEWRQMASGEWVEVF
ncbi:hypothetical protein QE418_003397 [Microbacterium testaceum]|nr:hypothetical protein [Microbacterium testaceum]MDR6098944.1 hypothetical protein [Microbacterium sp. SORGH_AS_0454]